MLREYRRSFWVKRPLPARTGIPRAWPKSAACAAQRGFAFAFATRLFDGPVFERTHDRRDYGEVRTLAIGRIDGELFVLVYTQEFDRWPK